MSDGGFRSHEFTMAKPPLSGAPSTTDQTLSKAPEPVPTAVSADDSQKLVALVDQLPLDQREAVTLYYFDRWALDRVAAAMQRTPEQVAELLLGATRTLREGLGNA